VRPPKLALRTAAGGLVVAATLALGVAGAAAAPDPGFGSHGTGIDLYNGSSYVTSVSNPNPITTHLPFAATEDGSQTANVPTLAWVGEDVRLVACDDSILANPLRDGSIPFQEAHFNVNEWTGDQSVSGTPTFDGNAATDIYVTNTGSASFFFPNDNLSADHKGCVSADVSSLHAGLTEVTLNVYQQSSIGDGTANTNQGGYNVDPKPVYSEQFWVAFMTANQPTITEATPSSIEFPGNGSQDQLTTAGKTALAGFLGDATTAGTFPSLDTTTPDSWNANNTPATNNGLVDVRVTGTFPIEDTYGDNTNANEFGSAAYVMPRDWVKLAGILAYSSTTNTPPGSNPSLWDIHGGPNNAPGHAGPSTGICQNDTGPFSQLTDTVDDCVSNGAGAGNAWAFSNVFGDVTSGNGGAGVGPYDAEAYNETLISDGNLNADDAPMPALPVTLSIAPNSGASADISGIGGLYGVSKYQVYSHDFNGSLSGPVALESNGKTANLYNPYYQEYIPSTQRPINEASGVTGVFDGGGSATSGDDFPGFDNKNTTPYTFWYALDAANTENTKALNLCAQSFGKDGQGIPEGSGIATDYATPDQPTSVVVYTDERGEAYVDYNPGTGWYENGYVSVDRDSACDLQGLLGKPIGTSAISAQAEYPYEAVPYPAIPVSNTLTKTAISQWSKTLTAYPKENTATTNDVSILVASATDVNGLPITGEEVCFVSTPAQGMMLDQENFTLPTGTVYLAGSQSDKTPKSLSSNYLCGDTNSHGNVGIDVSGSLNPSVDVQAVFVPEHIYRDVTVTLGQSTTVVSSAPPTVIPVGQFPSAPAVGSAGGSGSGSSSNTGSGTTTGTPAAPSTPLAQAKVANVCKVQSVHLRSKNGKYSVSFKLSCTSAKSMSITIRAFKANGKLLRSFKETVATNKSVSVSLGSKKIKRVTIVA
jgi:hypothetical protein